MMILQLIGKPPTILKDSIWRNQVFLFFVIHNKSTSLVECRLLNREQIEDEESSLYDEEEDGFLKAFKVCNFLKY